MILRFLKPCTIKLILKAYSSQDIVLGRRLKSLSFRMTVEVEMESWWAISVIEIFSTSFWAMIALERALFKENSSRHASRFKVRNVRRLGIHINDIILILGSLMSSRFVIKCNCSIRFFWMIVWSLFIIDLLGLFF